MRAILSLVFCIAVAASAGSGGDSTTKKISFKDAVFPVIKANCLPCHAEDNFNPSELSLDSYELMKAGGKNGDPWEAGDSEKSIIVQKLRENPPFDARMPMNSKRKIKEGKAKWLSDEEVKLIADWIDQGAKNN